MYPINSDVAALFADSARQVVKIDFQGVSGSMNITDEDIVQGTFSINRYSASGDTIELGNASAAELKFSLNNSDGRFNSVTFEGARMAVQVGVVNNNTVSYINMGVFTIDEVPRKLEQISIVALDDMVLFDKPVDYNAISLPITVGGLVSRLCTICGVRMYTDASTLPNGTYSISEITGNPATYRQLLIWAGEITGTCAYIDWDGYLRMSWYDDTSAETFNTQNRFASAYEENTIILSGVRVASKEAEVLVGSDDYAVNIEGNGLISVSDMEVIANNLYAVIGGFTYLPFSATVTPRPQLYPLDCVSFAVKSRSNISTPVITYSTVLTETTFKLNGSQLISAKGESATRNAYASLNPFTRREQLIVQHLLSEENESLGGRIDTVIAFNELISNALGLYVTAVKQEDGSVIYYMHDAPTLEQSQTIFTLTSHGIAWTDSGWNDGDPVWESGVTAAGDALFRLLSAEGIQVSKAGEDYSIEITPSAFLIYYRNMLVTQIVQDTMTIPRAEFTSYAEVGRIRLVPYRDSNNDLVGTNIVFVS